MRGVRSPTPSLVLLATALLLFACAAETSQDGGVTVEALPSATPRPFPTDETFEDVEPPDEGAAVCISPYPAGASNAPADEPERIRPPARPPALERFAPAPAVVDEELEELVLDAIGEEDEDRVSVVIKNLADGRGVTLRQGARYYAASLFKTWVMLEVFHQQQAGTLDLAEEYVVAEYYAQFNLNAGELAYCEQVSLGGALQRMIAISDNVAANLLLDRAGSGNINAALSAFGMAGTSIPEDRSLPTTAADMALLLEAIATRQAISSEASDAMLSLLASEGIADRLPARLPAGTVVAHKTGNWTNATHDAGVVFSPDATFVIVVMTDFGYETDAASLIAELARLAYEHYN